MKISERSSSHWPEGITADLSPSEHVVKDILDGLAVLYESPLITDIRNTLLAFPDARLNVALNKKQVACKKWLVDEVYNATKGELRSVYILAGWYGVLGALLLNDRRFSIEHLIVIDQDKSCAPVANRLNAASAANGRFSFQVADILELDYRDLPKSGGYSDLIINTSCEHLGNFARWYSKLPDNPLLVLQSNNYWKIPEHVNCVPTVEAFQDQAPMAELLYSGALELEKYTRFMLIGRKKSAER